jgi:hypothetical protein
LTYFPCLLAAGFPIIPAFKIQIPLEFSRALRPEVNNSFLTPFAFRNPGKDILKLWSQPGLQARQNLGADRLGTAILRRVARPRPAMGHEDQHYSDVSGVGLQFELVEQLVRRRIVMLGDQLDDAPKSADFDRIMISHRDVELAIDIGG